VGRPADADPADRHYPSRDIPVCTHHRGLEGNDVPESTPNDPVRSSTRDHSTLRARLVGRKPPEDRSIEAELRNLMVEREALASKETKPERG
jgi:hypothetical protein